MHRSPFVAVALVALSSLALVARSDPPKDWPMWGGTPDRNLVSSMKGAPTSWDIKTKKNVKWVAELGSQSYGNPVVSNGVVLVGTNNEAMKDPAIKGDKGVLMAFRESDGQFLWQSVRARRARHRGLPRQGERRAVQG
jgi:outer membrane protein assembly factor BamB